MKLLTKSLIALALLGLCLFSSNALAQDYDRDYNSPTDSNDDYYDRGSIDRYLDVEVWTDHADADYYTGDEVVIHFRANRDAFVAIYSIDSRGMVNLLFPVDPAQDNFIRGGVSYSLPGQDDDYELVLNGPEGTEHIQIIASRERFPIPEWYHNSGMVFDGEDVYDYMDWLNGRYFVRYSGQRFAYDRAVVFVNEWEPTYFRPVYYPDYPSWAVVGNVYIDYPWGSTVYVNGYYWGVTPLYIPRILVGWHTLTIYDRWGSCWEHDFHVSRYHTVVFDRTVIVPTSSVHSKFTKVQTVGYRNPVQNGYSNYDKMVASMQTKTTSSRGTVVKGTSTVRSTSSVDDNYVASSKKYIRGETKLVKTDRGYETSSATTSGKSRGADSYRSGTTNRTKSQSGTSDSYSSGSSRSTKSTTKSGDYSGSSSSSSKSKSGSSSSYYKKKTGSTSSGSSKGSSTSKTYQSKTKTKTKTSSSTSGSSSSGSKVSKSKSSTEKSSSSKTQSSSNKSSSDKSSSSKNSSSKNSSSKSSSSSSSKGKTKR